MTKHAAKFDLRSRFDIALAAALFSTGGAAIKLSTLNGWQVSGLRSLVAVLALSALLPRARGHWTWKVWVVAAFYSLTLTVFTLSTKLTTAANAIFLQSTAPLYIMAVAPFVLKERFRVADAGVAAAFVLGLVAILSGGSVTQETAPNPALGNGLGVLAGVCWASTLMGLRWLGRSRSENTGTDLGATAVIAGNGLTFLIALPFMFEPMEHASAIDALILVYLGVFQVAAPYALLTRGIRAVPAFSASIIILIELALNPVWTWIVHGEQLSRLSLVGGVMILSASVAKASLERDRGPS